MLKWVWLICRNRQNPDTLDVQIDYLFEEVPGKIQWAPDYLANRYTPETAGIALTLLHRLYNQPDDGYTRYYPVKVSLTHLNQP